MNPFQTAVEPARLLDAEEALEAARAILAASPAAETEVVLDSTVDAFVRYADSGPTQSADRQRVDVAIRVRMPDAAGGPGFREARARCGSLDPAITRKALEQALALCAVSPVNPDLPPMGGSVQAPATAADSGTLAHTFEEKARWVKLAVDACAQSDLAPAGLLSTGACLRAIVNSNGREALGERSRASFSLTASGRKPGSGSGWAEQVSGRVERIDPEAVVRRAVEKALANAEPRAVDPGRYTVVLEPAAVSSVLLFASYRGFGAREVAEQGSFLCGRIGHKVFSECFTLTDDPSHRACPGLAFDGEGTPHRPLALVERGVLRGPVTDRTYAARAGDPDRSTGHALQQPSSHGPMAEHLVVAPGKGTTEQLIAGVERGLLVTRFHYTNLIEPRELVLTGMTRNGTWLIEGGKVTAPVRNLRFTQSLVEALGRVRAVGSQAEVAGALFDGEVITPPLVIDDFRFTSTTDF